MKDQKTTKYAKPVSQRAIAAVLAGLMLMSTVPAQAIAEEIQDAQAVVAAQTATDGTEEVSQPTATDTTAAADQQTTDTTAADTTSATDAGPLTPTCGSDAIDASTAAAAAAASLAAAEEKAAADAKDTKTDDAKDDAKDDKAADKKDDTSKDSVNSDSSTKTRTWSSYNGGGATDSAINTLKGLASAIGDVIGQKYGSGAVALIGVLTQDNSAKYTNNDIMYKLYDMENQISGVSTQVYNLQNSFSNFEAESFYRSDMKELRGYRDLLCRDGGGVQQGLAELNDTLNKFKELDENGKTTDVACSLETPAERMPDDARKAAEGVISRLDRLANSYTNRPNVAGTEYVLSDAITSRSNNFVNDYFDLLSRKYNFDVESFPARQDFIAMLGQMYVSAYTITSASLRLQIADGKANGFNTSGLESELAALSDRAGRVKEALFGEDGNSGFLAQTVANGKTVKCYVNGQTYNVGTYACLSAYTPAPFENAYAEGIVRRADYCASSWNVNSTFTSDQVVQMVNQLKAMKANGTAPKKSDGTEVDGILEEMEAIGFKNVKTDGNEQNTTWNERLSGHKGYSTWDGYKVFNRFVELGDPNQQNLLPDAEEFHLGDRLEGSSDYVITNVTKPRMKAGSRGAGFDRGGYQAYCAYGDVVNVKTGALIKDQLLYVLHNECEKQGYVSTLEYYAFGTLRLGTTDPSISAIPR